MTIGWSVGTAVGRMIVNGTRVGVGSRVAVGGTGVLVMVTVGILGESANVPSETVKKGS